MKVTGALTFQACRSFAKSRLAPVVLGTWAFAEAIAWPVIPDFLIFPLAILAPRRWFVFLVVSLAGSVCGGLVAYYAGGSSVGPELLGFAPLVTDSMIDSARSTLQESGAAGLLSQPLSGIPYKVFAYQARPEGIGAFDYLGMSALARGTRFFVVVLMGAAGGALLRRVWERLFSKFLAAYTIVFAVGLARTVSYWR